MWHCYLLQSLIKNKYGMVVSIFKLCLLFNLTFLLRCNLCKRTLLFLIRRNIRITLICKQKF